MKRTLQCCVIILAVLLGGYVVAFHGFAAVVQQVVQSRASVDVPTHHPGGVLLAIGF